MWGDQPTPSSRKALQGCVVRLRRELGAGHIETSAHGYTLDVPAEEIDAHRFERLTLRSRELLLLGEPERAASTVTQALDLWRGLAYEDVESWDPAMIESARLQELRLEAEELRVDASLRAGLHLDVLAAAGEHGARPPRCASSGGRCSRGPSTRPAARSRRCARSDG